MPHDFNTRGVVAREASGLAGYRADDRDTGPQKDGEPDLPALLNLWRDRDALYATMTLTLRQEALIRTHRQQEALLLPQDQRIRGWTIATTFPKVIA